VRHLLRKHHRQVSEVIADLRTDIERAQVAVADQAKRLHDADRALCSAVAEGALPLFARRGNAAGGRFTGLDHEAVPPAFFFNRHRTINMLWEWATLRDDAPMEEWALWRTQEAPDWGDLRFPKAAILARFPLSLAEPSRAPAGAPNSGPSEAAELSPKMSDLPARWTLLECLAWIMFRDTRIVRDASLEMPREAAPYMAEARVPGSRAQLARMMGEPAYNRLRLTVEWAYDRAQGSPVPGLEPRAAEADLLVKLRSGAITARGRTATDDTPRDMDPGDWRGLALVERTRSELTAEPERMTGQAWRDVTIARDDAAREWPYFGEVQQPMPKIEPADPARPPSAIPGPELIAAAPIASGTGGEPPPVYTHAALKFWFALRRSTWPRSHPPPSEADDLAAANAHFRRQVPRDPFRAIRRELAPDDWKKPGPRRRRG
jgi:hypothetical protein